MTRLDLVASDAKKLTLSNLFPEVDLVQRRELGNRVPLLTMIDVIELEISLS